MAMQAIPAPRPAAAVAEPAAPTTLAQFARTLDLADVTSPGVFAVRVADWVTAPGTTADLATIRATEGATVATVLKNKSLPKDHPGRALLGTVKPAIDRTTGSAEVEVFLPGEHRFDNGSTNTAVLVRVKSTMGGKPISEMRSPLNWAKLLANVDAGGDRLRETITRCLN